MAAASASAGAPSLAPDAAGPVSSAVPATGAQQEERIRLHADFESQYGPLVSLYKQALALPRLQRARDSPESAPRPAVALPTHTELLSPNRLLELRACSNPIFLHRTLTYRGLLRAPPVPSGLQRRGQDTRSQLKSLWRLARVRRGNQGRRAVLTFTGCSQSWLKTGGRLQGRTSAASRRNAGLLSGSHSGGAPTWSQAQSLPITVSVYMSTGDDRGGAAGAAGAWGGGGGVAEEDRYRLAESYKLVVPVLSGPGSQSTRSPRASQSRKCAPLELSLDFGRFLGHDCVLVVHVHQVSHATS